jgi:hypothetical protein
MKIGGSRKWALIIHNLILLEKRKWATNLDKKLFLLFL